MNSDQTRSPTRRERGQAKPAADTGTVAKKGADHPSRSRIGGAWTALAVAVIVLVLLLVFILQNQNPAQVEFLGMTGSMPLGVLVLLSAALGALVVMGLGAARMVQLKAQARRQRRQLRSGK